GTARCEGVLGRAVDPSGQATFGPQLDGGVARGTVAAAVLTSPEAEQRSVQGFYSRFLHRAADPAGLEAWVGRMRLGAAEEVIQAGVVGSDESFALRQTGPSAAPAEEVIQAGVVGSDESFALRQPGPSAAPADPTISGRGVILAGQWFTDVTLPIPHCDAPDEFLVTGVYVGPEIVIGSTAADVVQLPRWGVSVPVYQ